MELHNYWGGMSRHPYGRTPDVMVPVSPASFAVGVFLYAEVWFNDYPKLSPLRIARSRLGWHTYNCSTFVCDVLGIPSTVNPNELIEWLSSPTTAHVNPAVQQTT